MLGIDLDRAKKAIEGFIKSSVEGGHMKGAVLGLSGGLDSSLVAALAANELGAKNVLGVMMPHKQSNPDSLAHAKLVAEKFGFETKTIDITQMAEGYHEKLDKLRLGNLLARLRMCVLFDQSKTHDAIVLGTSNKSEMMIGYSTWYGDMAAGVYPIGDLYKTQVRALAKHIGVPQVIIDKPPTADLWSGQTDEGEIGETYERLDKILYLLIEVSLSIEEVSKQGFKNDEVKAIYEKMRKSQFKRILPPVCKITSRTIDWDFRYIKDWSA